MDAIEFTISHEQSGLRLDKLLADTSQEQTSRERVQQLIKDGNVTINGAVVKKAATKAELDQVVKLTFPEPVALDMSHWDMPLDIVYEDAHLAVINKPRGMLTHPTGKQQPDTLVNALLHHCKGELSGINGVERPGIVHRLDRDTEGLLVIAKSDEAHHHLSEQLKAKTMQRRYNAIVQGNVVEETGKVNIAIARHPKQRNAMMADWSGKSAVTHYHVKERLNDRFTWVQCQLETGRTHQIRVHMAHLGHPLVADVMYGTGLEKQWVDLPQDGQALQAYQLQFMHPITQKPMRFTLEPSAYLLSIWDVLKKHV